MHAPAAGAQTPAPAPVPSKEVAIILRVASVSNTVAPDGSTVRIDAASLRQYAKDIAQWSQTLGTTPFSLAVSPSMCEDLALSKAPEARVILNELRALARRGQVLTVPYADVWLPFLTTERAVRSQLTYGRDVLRSCLGQPAVDVLFAHVLHAGGPEPTGDVDKDVIEAARGLLITDVVLQGISQTPVKDGLTLVPIGEAQPMRKTAIVRDAWKPQGRSSVKALGADPDVLVVPVQRLGDDAPVVAVAYPEEPRVPGRYRRAAENMLASTSVFGSFTLLDNPLRKPIDVARALALSQISKDAERAVSTHDERQVGEGFAEQLQRTIRKQFAAVSVDDGAITFTSRRGSVPITVSNTATFPVRLRVTAGSPKLNFPAGRTRVVTVKPPGDTITFEALARSTGSFPVTVTLRSADRSVMFDGAELTVRSTAGNLPALVLTGGGLLFLLGWLGGRIRRRRAA
jgi:hypothetical protein